MLSTYRESWQTIELPRSAFCSGVGIPFIGIAFSQDVWPHVPCLLEARTQGHAVNIGWILMAINNEDQNQHEDYTQQQKGCHM